MYTDMDYTQKVREIFSRRESPPLCCVQSFGCQQNVADGERITGMLCDMGCGIAPDISGADIVILNTCAVREGRRMSREYPCSTLVLV